MKKKEIKEICQATFRRLYSFPKEDYKFFDWDIKLDAKFNEYYVVSHVVSKRHCIYRCSCFLTKTGQINNEHCRALA